MNATFELDGFEPISRLGGGGFGDVWLARQTNVDRQVAIKVGHSAIQDETIRLRFDRECKALGRLSGHSNIVDVYTAGSLNDGRPYLVLEYINGGTLWQRLKKSPVPESELVSIGGQMAAALAEAHSSGVLHRDLKPENILIRASGEAVLGDFGIARLHDGANTTSAAITASVAYAAPEILSGKRATVASDLYGIGVCLLAAVFRSVPFVQKTDESIHPIINRVLSDSPPDVRRHGISEGLASLIDSLLAKDPADRPASAADVMARFQALPDAGTPLIVPKADVGATQVVSNPVAAAPVAPVAPNPANDQQTVSRPPTDPRPEDAAPGLYNPNANPPQKTLAKAAAANITTAPPPPSPNDVGPTLIGARQGQSQATPFTVVKEPGSNLKFFGLAYLATMVVGGLILFLLFQLLEDDSADETSAASFTQEPAADPVAQESDGPVEPPEDAGNEGGLLQDGASLTIPLDVSDTSFGPDAETSSDSFGPGSGTMCDNAPATDGLADWKGQTITTGGGVQSLYQVVSRFETADQAAAYLDAYAETNDCESWVVDNEDGSNVTFSAQQTAPPAFGDRARRFEVLGELDGPGLQIYARLVLVQSGTDVLTMNLSALSEDDAAELDLLAPLAAERLGFTS